MTFFEKSLAFLGLAKAKRLGAANAKVAELSTTLKISKAEIQTLETNLANVTDSLNAAECNEKILRDERERERKRHIWCKPELAEFGPGTPKDIHLITRQSLQIFTRNPTSLFHLLQPNKFNNPQHWPLYWCLAHASQAAADAAKAAKDENGCSRAFLDALALSARQITDLMPESQLQIAFNAIFEQVKPAMKEESVGADILLIVAGQTLIPDGFARLFWVQGKRSKTNDFTLSYDQKNDSGYQIDALRKAHQPANGSIGLYTQYSKNLLFTPAVLVSQLPKDTYTADLSNIGIRLPELIVTSLSKVQGLGSFADTDEIITYLNKLSGMKPLYVVTVTEGGMRYDLERRLKQLLSTISDHYRKQLGLDRDAKPEIGRGPDFSR